MSIICLYCCLCTMTLTDSFQLRFHWAVLREQVFNTVFFFKLLQSVWKVIIWGGVRNYLVQSSYLHVNCNIRQLYVQTHYIFLCLWFRASLLYINNCPTRCNTNQSIYYSESSLYMFRVSTTPIIRSTQNCNYSLRYCSLAEQIIWPVPEAVVTVLCTPDDGCGWHPKHIEWTCRIIIRLLCVTSRWTTIDTVLMFIGR